MLFRTGDTQAERPSRRQNKLRRSGCSCLPKPVSARSTGPWPVQCGGLMMSRLPIRHRSTIAASRNPKSRATIGPPLSPAASQPCVELPGTSSSFRMAPESAAKACQSSWTSSSYVDTAGPSTAVPSVVQSADSPSCGSFGFYLLPDNLN